MSHHRRAVIVLTLILVGGGTASTVHNTTAYADGLEIGDKVNDFTLPVVGGNDYLTLSEQYEQGPVVLVVLRGYPGAQCPLCRQQVRTLITRVRAASKKAHRIILLYPGEHDLLEIKARRFLGPRHLPEEIVMVRDDGMKTTGEMGLRWNRRGETVYPATYILDRNGRVRWKKVSQSHAERSTVEEILRELRKL